MSMSKKEWGQMNYAEFVQKEIELQLSILDQFGGDSSCFRERCCVLLSHLRKVIVDLWMLESDISNALAAAWLKREDERGVASDDQERD